MSSRAPPRFMCERLAAAPAGLGASTGAAAPSGGSALLDQTAQLLAELGSVLVAVNCHGVLHRRVEDLVLAVGRDRHRATHLARILPAVDEFASHVALLWSLSPTLLPEARRVNAGDVMDGWGELAHAPASTSAEGPACRYLRSCPRRYQSAAASRRRPM